ncbi:MAG: hypothetical protein KJ597_04520 [Nanoarchaeota archaeon]|nr:hypothetical protein [Nanoarchaeota archaeon]MBU1622812.1 hypothetical protein [Nanoarchaeota archaeon]
MYKPMNKITQTLGLAGAFGLAPVLGAGCSFDDSNMPSDAGSDACATQNSYNLNVTVDDYLTGQPIEGAIVRARWGEQHEGTLHEGTVCGSEENGTFSCLEVPFGVTLEVTVNDVTETSVARIDSCGYGDQSIRYLFGAPNGNGSVSDTGYDAQDAGSDTPDLGYDTQDAVPEVSADIGSDITSDADTQDVVTTDAVGDPIADLMDAYTDGTGDADTSGETGEDISGDATESGCTDLSQLVRADGTTCMTNGACVASTPADYATQSDLGVCASNPTYNEGDLVDAAGLPLSDGFISGNNAYFGEILPELFPLVADDTAVLTLETISGADGIDYHLFVLNGSFTARQAMFAAIEAGSVNGDECVADLVEGVNCTDSEE